LQRQRSLIIWITDLADTSMTPEVIESASQILSKHLLLFMVIAQPDLEALANAREEAAEADHLRAAASLMHLQRQRSLIIWITDLADTSMTPEVIESASQILSKHLLLFMVIAQPDLEALAAGYPQDAEQMYHMVAAQELVQRRETLISRVRNRGALALEVAPDKLTVSLVNQYLQVKERNLI